MAKPLTDYEAALAHKYRVEPGGEFVPGVTSAIGILDKPQLVWAAAGIAAHTANVEHRRKSTIVRRHRKTLTALGKKEREMGYNGSDDEVFEHFCRGQHQREWTEKTDRGTRVHAVAEAWTTSPGEEVEVRAEDSGFFDALENFYRDHSPKFLMAELVVLNPDHRYGGRFDAIVTTSEGTFLLDYKTGGHYEATLAMQQVAYMNGKVAVYSDDDRLEGFMPLPELDGARGLYLREDGSYELIDPFANISQEKAWRGFLACLETYKAVKEMGAS